jgi:hypothetical protein
VVTEFSETIHGLGPNPGVHGATDAKAAMLF